MIIVRAFQDLTELNVFLQGGVIGGRSLRSAVSSAGDPSVNEGIYRLDGKTLIFNSPASETVTFASTNAIQQEPMTLQQVKTQIEAQTTGVVVRWTKGGRLLLIEVTPASSVTIDEAGTANSLLGFDTSGDTVGAFVNSDGSTSPFIISLVSDDRNGKLLLVLEE